MKALIYKEFKLSMHPICYLFVAAFPLMILIPSYPIGIGFIYVLTCYPILFLGANKGQQSNDLSAQERYRLGKNSHCHFYAISIHDHHVRSLSSSAKYRRLD